MRTGEDFPEKRGLQWRPGGWGWAGGRIEGRRVARRTSLVIHWLRICPLLEGTQVRSLLQEDPMCCRATEPMSHNDWACALEPMHCSKRRHHSEKPVHCNQRSPHSPLLEQAWVPQRRAAQPKIKQINFKWSEKLQWDITSHQSEWPSSKNLQTVSAGKSLEKREPSCSVQLLSRVRHGCNPVDCSLPGSSVHGIS